MNYKLCFITTTPNNLRTFLLEAAKYMYQETGWDITFISDDDSKIKDDLPDYIHYHAIPMKRGIKISGIKALAQFIDYFRKEKFDLVQYSTPNASLYASLAGKLTNTPVRLYCQWGIVFSAYRGLFRKILWLEEKLVCSLSTWIEPDSIGNLKFAHEYDLYPKHVGNVIWNGSACGVDLEKFGSEKKSELSKRIRADLDISENSFIVGFVGRITRDKGINELLAAFKAIYKGKKDIHLLIVGDVDPKPQLDEALFNWSKTCRNIHYAGWVDRIEEYFAVMDCFVLPSYREGFGLVIVEAEAMGVPVIVTDIPGPRDAMIDQKTGLVIPPRDWKALVKAIYTLYYNPELKEKLSKAGIKFAKERFDQKRFFEYLLADRKRLLNNAKNKRKR